MRWWTPLVFIAAAASAAPVELQEQIHIARAGILPKTVFIFVVGRNFSDGSEQRQIWGGSGVIISTDGYVASNSHVLSHSSRVRAMLSDGTSYEGRVIGTDEETDLGLLQLTRTGDQAPLPAVEFADSSPVAGDFVLAIGSPHFLTRSVTFGIVNNPRQSLYENDLYNWVQTDALINPGNSGGPLINLAGKLVGINTRGGDGMGFAIPSTVVREITERLRRDGRVERSMLGLTLQARNDFRHETYVDAAQGALIIGVESNSPAAAAGFQVGDLLLAAGGQAIDAPYPEDMATTRRLLADLKPGVATRFMLLRSGKTLSLTAVPRARAATAADGEAIEAREWMLTARVVGEGEESIEGYYRPKGLAVLAVVPRGNAERSGLEADDIFLDVDGVEIKSLEDFRRVYEKSLRRAGVDRLILATVLRRGLLLKIALDFSRPRAAQETP